VPPDPPLFDLDVMFSPDPPTFESLAPTPALRHVVESSWESLSAWLDRLHDFERPPAGDEDLPLPEWDLIERADGLARRPIADVEVHLDVLPVAGTPHWLLTEEPDRHLIHAVVTPTFILNPWDHDDWLLDALARTG
jgi:hypothetical protein